VVGVLLLVILLLAGQDRACRLLVCALQVGRSEGRLGLLVVGGHGHCSGRCGSTLALLHKLAVQN